MPPPPFAVVCWNLDFTSPPQVQPDGQAAEYIASSIATLLGDSGTPTPTLLFLLECNAGHFQRGVYHTLDTALARRGFSTLQAVNVSTKECILVAVRGMTLMNLQAWNGWRAHYQEFEDEANDLLSTRSIVTTRSGLRLQPTVVPNAELRDIAMANIQLSDGSILRVGAMHAASPGRGSGARHSGGSGVPVTAQHVSSVLHSLLGVADILVGDFNLRPNTPHVTTVNRTTLQATGFHSFNAFYTSETTTTGGHRYDHAYMAPGYVCAIRVLQNRGATIRSVHDPIMLRDIIWGPVQVPFPPLMTLLPQLGQGSAEPSGSRALVPVPPMPTPPRGFDFSAFSAFASGQQPPTFDFSGFPSLGGLFSHGSAPSFTLPPSSSTGSLMERHQGAQRAARQEEFRSRRGMPALEGGRGSLAHPIREVRRRAVTQGRSVRLSELVRLLGQGTSRAVVARLRRVRLLIRSGTENGYRLIRALRYRTQDGDLMPLPEDIFRGFDLTMSPLLARGVPRPRLVEEEEPVQRLAPDSEVVGVAWDTVDGDSGAWWLAPGPFPPLL